MEELQKKLNKIQKDLKAPKNQENSFGHYSYRSCEDILEAIKPLLDGLVITISDEIVNIGDRFYVKATVKLIDGDKSIKATAYAREALTKKGMDEAQITGSASSYARKYALNGLFAIDDTKDADTQDNKDTKPPKDTKPKKASIDQIKSIKEMLELKGKTDEVILKTLKVEKLEDISVKQAEGIINQLNK